jgi:hypothetical protein
MTAVRVWAETNQKWYAICHYHGSSQSVNFVQLSSVQAPTSPTSVHFQLVTEWRVQPRFPAGPSPETLDHHSSSNTRGGAVEWQGRKYLRGPGGREGSSSAQFLHQKKKGNKGKSDSELRRSARISHHANKPQSLVALSTAVAASYHPCWLQVWPARLETRGSEIGQVRGR